MGNIFQVNANNPYSLKSRNELYCRNPKTVKYGTKTMCELARKILSLVPEVIKRSKTDIFKKQNKKMES